MRTKSIFVQLVSLLILGIISIAYGENTKDTAKENESASCPALLDHSVQKLHRKDEVHLCKNYANKVILAVNTASQCGYTPQFEGLEKLYQQYKDQGLVVLGFPSNDFFQDRESNEEIAKFCRINYGVTFPMFSKSPVRGWNANPFYKALAAEQGQAPRWNFFKYLIDRRGKVVNLYNSRVEPFDPKLIQDIEKLL